MSVLLPGTEKVPNTICYIESVEQTYTLEHGHGFQVVKRTVNTTGHQIRGPGMLLGAGEV